MSLLDQLFAAQGWMQQPGLGLLGQSGGFEPTPEEIAARERASQAAFELPQRMGMRAGKSPFGPFPGLLGQDLLNDPQFGFGALPPAASQSPGLDADPAGVPQPFGLDQDPAGSPLPMLAAGLDADPGGIPALPGLNADPAGTPPSTNDPMSGEPVLFENGVPLPRSRPADAPKVAGPMSLAPEDYDDKLPPNSTPATHIGPQRGAPVAAPAQENPLKTLLTNFLSAENAPLLLALGSGFAGAPSIGTGLRRASAAAVGPAQTIAATRSKREAETRTARALAAKGATKEEVDAAVGNPLLLKALIEKYYDPGKVMEVEGQIVRVGGDGSVSKLADFSGRKAPTTVEVAGANGPIRLQYVDGKWSPIPGQSGQALGKVVEVKGRLVEVRPDGSSRVLADFSEEADDKNPVVQEFKLPDRSTQKQQWDRKEKRWKDIPGFEKPAPPDTRENEKIDVEMAGRLGMATVFLRQLPDIRKQVEAGKVTGGWDAAKAMAGVGEPGEIRRKIDSGADALLRMLTGAGMGIQEAGDYTRRYRVAPIDNAESLLSKLKQLELELFTIGDVVGKGRGGNILEEFRARIGPEGGVQAPKLKVGGSTVVNGVTIKRTE